MSLELLRPKRSGESNPGDLDAWAHVYALPPEDRRHAFQLVRLNIVTVSENGDNFVMPDEAPETTLKLSELEQAAKSTTLELKRKEF